MQQMLPFMQAAHTAVNNTIKVICSKVRKRGAISWVGLAYEYSGRTNWVKLPNDKWTLTRYVGSDRHTMKSKERKIFELESELLKLNSLVRARRQTLARLAACTNKHCECRAVWREPTEKTLASQVGKVSSRVANGKAKAVLNGKSKAPKPAKAKAKVTKKR